MANESKVKFGVRSLDRPTPMALRYVFRTFLYLSGLWALLAPTLTHIPTDVLNQINTYLLIGNTIMNFTIKFFGLDFSDKPDTDNP